MPGRLNSRRLVADRDTARLSMPAMLVVPGEVGHVAELALVVRDVEPVAVDHSGRPALNAIVLGIVTIRGRHRRSRTGFSC